MSVEQATDYGPTLVAILLASRFRACSWLWRCSGSETRKTPKSSRPSSGLGTHWQAARALFPSVLLTGGAPVLIFDIEAAFWYPGGDFTVDCPAWNTVDSQRVRWHRDVVQFRRDAGVYEHAGGRAFAVWRKRAIGWG